MHYLKEEKDLVYKHKTQGFLPRGEGMRFQALSSNKSWRLRGILQGAEFSLMVKFLLRFFEQLLQNNLKQRNMAIIYLDIHCILLIIKATLMKTKINRT